MLSASSDFDMSVTEVIAGGIVSSAAVLSAVIYLFKVSFEARIAQEVERFKADLSVKLEEIKSDLRQRESQEDATFRQLLEFRASQLSEFYWPLYLGLQKDNVIWRLILEKETSSDQLRKRVGGIIEREVILPNHEKLVALIEKYIYLAEADGELEALFLAYIRHVAVYRSIRAAGDDVVFPVGKEAWPNELCPAVERRLRDLQSEFNGLLKSQQEGVKR